MWADLVKVERQELYDLVWSQPMSRLAKTYGISDVALKKVCRRLEIPTPPRGYWAKKAAGHPVEKPPLEEPSSPQAAGPWFVNPDKYKREKHTVTPLALRGPDASAPEHVSVPASLRDPHPLVIRTREMMTQNLTRTGFISAPRGSGCLDIVVSRNQLDRALRIMDTLIKALASRGYTLEVSAESGQTSVTVAGEKLAIGLREGRMRVPHLLTREERRSSYYGTIPRYDYAPSGELYLEILELDRYPGVRVRRRWSDSARQQLENCLGSFIEGVTVAAAALKEWRAMRERQRQRELEEVRRRLEEERRLLQEEERRRAEEARRQQLLADAEAWARAEMLRSYLRAAADQKRLEDGDIDPDSEFGQWLQWATQVADGLDPLKKRVPVVRSALSNASGNGVESRPAAAAESNV